VVSDKERLSYLVSPGPLYLARKPERVKLKGRLEATIG
jgi:hypothetical protein